MEQQKDATNGTEEEEQVREMIEVWLEVKETTNMNHECFHIPESSLHCLVIDCLVYSQYKLQNSFLSFYFNNLSVKLCFLHITGSTENPSNVLGQQIVLLPSHGAVSV